MLRAGSTSCVVCEAGSVLNASTGTHATAAIECEFIRAIRRSVKALMVQHLTDEHGRARGIDVLSVSDGLLLQRLRRA